MWGQGQGMYSLTKETSREASASREAMGNRAATGSREATGNRAATANREATGNKEGLSTWEGKAEDLVWASTWVEGKASTDGVATITTINR